MWVRLCNRDAATEGYRLYAFALYGIIHVHSQKETLLPNEWGNGVMNGPCGSSILNESPKLSLLDNMVRTFLSQVDRVYEVPGSTINIQA